MSKKITPILLAFSLVSCIQNPEAELQNEKISDLKEKNEYLNKKIEDQNQKLNDLEEKIKELDLKIDIKSSHNKRIKQNNSYKKNYPDSLNVNVNFIQK